MRHKKKSRLAAAVELSLILIVTANLFVMAADYALVERGYHAVGGEGLIPLVPIIYYLVKRVIRDFAADVARCYRNPPEG